MVYEVNMSAELELEQSYWVRTDSEDFYVPARLVSAEDGNNLTFEVFETGVLLRVVKDDVVGIIPPPADITLQKNFTDLVTAVDISEPSILWNLKRRFMRNEIYSAIGPILIALNPYKYIEPLYNAEVLKKYLQLDFNSDASNSLATKGDQPHIWSIARNSYLQLNQSSNRQAIIISGESGAGKTEATKKCLQYLSSVSLLHQQGKSMQHRDAIEDRVLDTNPLLESFGNAKTARNNNSSRFGKWLDIIFKENKLGARNTMMELVGAQITQYLLEKSRVVSQASEERNYHIFYQMCAHTPMRLGDARNFRFLNQSGSTVIDGVDDAADFLETLKSFDDLQFPG